MPVSRSRFFLPCLLFLGVFLGLVAAPAHAQDAALPFTSVSLDDLSAFRDPGTNWSVAGGVQVNRQQEGDLRTEPGTGILVNRPAEGRRANLLTEMEHGDIELEVEFIVPPGSNSGLYLMGRYEVQILDSWGADPVRFSDAGALYQRWDPARGAGREGFEGHPPRVNASRAPGLWQHFRIRFQAPRFDDTGRKVADARFVRVEHNGVVVHENVEVTGPTRAAAFDDEQPLGPLMLQGDHGPVAFRNLRYKRFDGTSARITDLRYRAYVEPTLDVASQTPRAEGTAPAVAGDRGGDRDRFTLVYEGRFHAPTEGDYLFDLGLEWVDNDPHFEGELTGAGRLWVGDDEVVRHDGRAPHEAGTVRLAPGEYPFRLIFLKDRPWNDPRMTLHVEGPGIARMPLHDPGAIPPSENVGAIAVTPEARPIVQRTFIPYGDTKRTHAAAVGDPAGVHYAIDLEGGALLYAWRGRFIETTPMWHERGSDQIALPLGVPVPLGGAPALADLPSPDAPWPATPSGYRFGGYALGDDGRPTFAYRIAGAQVEDVIRPTDEDRALHRRLRVTGGAGRYVRLADGARIVPADGGGFRVGEHLYVQPDAGLDATVRRVADRDELVVRIPEGETTDVGYTLIW